MNKQAYLFGAKVAVDKNLTTEEAKSLGKQIGIDWDKVDFPAEEFRQGVGIEYEHGTERGESTNVTKDAPEPTGRIAWAHLKELPDYYARLKKMESEGERAKEGSDDEDEGPGNSVSMPAVIDFLKRNPNPPDEAVHEFAEKKGYNVHTLEGFIYRLATQAAKAK